MRFNYINSMMARMNRAVGDAAEMTKVLDEPRLVEDAPGAPDLVVSEGAVDFERLAFRYEDAAEGDYVFRDLTLSVPAGQRVGLVGRSGSGKTTLTKLLLRLSDVQEGHIYVDGQDISACVQQSLRRQIAYVPQETLLFHRSIRENIAYGRPDATKEEIREAARLANALEFIDRLPHGLDTMVGERGVKLSGGQRQRVAIARAILADCPILVLDEATSASPARYWPTARSWSSTRPRARSTARARPQSRARSRTSCAAAPRSWWPTASPPSRPSTASWCWRRARSWRTAPTPSSPARAAPTRASGTARRGRSWKRSECTRRMFPLP